MLYTPLQIRARLPLQGRSIIRPEKCLCGNCFFSYYTLFGQIFTGWNEGKMRQIKKSQRENHNLNHIRDNN